MAIIKSLLDLDFYKLTMAQVAFRHFRNVPVKFAFKNRTVSVPIADFIKESQLRQELEAVRKLKVTENEIEYLRSLKIFREDFLVFLKNLTLPEFSLKRVCGNFEMEFSGTWPEVTFWETICLSITNELYYKNTVNFCDVCGEGQKRLARKIEILKANPKIKFSDFGTRRRFSRDWQEFVLKELIREVPNQLVGTSNVTLAMKLGLKPIGTFAHEMFMAFSGIFHDDIRGSHNKVLEYWWEEYGYDYSIALTDTYGTDFFFKDMTDEQARKWKGSRQDSGDPFAYGEKAVKFYNNKNIDPKTKLIVFSDGLDIETIVEIFNRFNDLINVLFGWGTNLMNDLGPKALSLVVKLIETDGYGTVKLSDNIAKATGKLEDVEAFKIFFEYTSTIEEECKY